MKKETLTEVKVTKSQQTVVAVRERERERVTLLQMWNLYLLDHVNWFSTLTEKIETYLKEEVSLFGGTIVLIDSG